MTTPDPTPETSSPGPRRGLLAVVVAIAACSLCLLPVLATSAGLASVAGWLTGATGLAIAAAVVAVGAGLTWMRRRDPHDERLCECGDCS